MLRPIMLTDKIESFSEIPCATVLGHGGPSPHPSTSRTIRCLTSVSRRNRNTTPHAQPVVTATLQQWKDNDGRILRNGRVGPSGDFDEFAPYICSLPSTDEVQNS